MKKWIAVCLCFLVFFTGNVCLSASDGYDILSLQQYLESMVPATLTTELNLDAQGAVLMEASTGKILYSFQSDKKLYPASVTKVMTMLLVMEALDSGKIAETDEVTASQNAASMGGSQIYLEVGEVMTVQELLKAVAINSANDAAVALAEFVCGSEMEFVAAMNRKASELGAINTCFMNPNGLHDEGHYTCAYDIALFTRELLTAHPGILSYTGIWMDSLRNGTFGLANTNKLLRTYSGMTGMKTGYTKEAGHCLSGTASRNGMDLIAVVLGAADSKARFASVAQLLDYGFANYQVVSRQADPIAPVPVTKGKTSQVTVRVNESLSVVLPKGKVGEITSEVVLEPTIVAPVQAGQQVGTLIFRLDGVELKSCPIVAAETVEKAGFLDYLGRIWQRLI